MAAFSIKKNDNLIVPYYLASNNDMRETLAREAVFSFPLATVGFIAGGPVGVLVGHTTGALLGYIRHRRIHG